MIWIPILMILGLLLFPAQALSGALEGLRLCGTAVIPALLPYLFLTRMLSSQPLPTGKASFFGISGRCLPAYALSFIGGYPAGVGAAVSLYENGRASKSEVQQLLRICNNSGPGFFVSVIGTIVLDSPQKGLLLYFLHLLGAILSALLVTKSTPHSVKLSPLTPKSLPFSQCFQTALHSSCTAMLQICGLVILFSTVIGLIRPLIPANYLPFLGALELTSGVLTVGRGKEAFLLCALLTGWGGLCVHMQAMSLWRSAGLQVRGYWSYKLLHGLISAILAAGLIYNIPLLFCSCILFSLFFSYIRKKWGRKMSRLAL